MALRINTNIAALNSHRQLLLTEVNMNKSMQKLSSGYRINNAGDDASGLVQANTLRSAVRVLKVESQNVLQQKAALAINEGDANTIENILERMLELKTKDTSSGGAIETAAEFLALADQITDIATAGSGGVTSLTAANLLVPTIAATAANINAAIATVGTALGTIGASMNAIEFNYSNIQTKIENTSAQESAIRDVDMAAEMVNFTKSQIMLQAGMAMLSQANMSSQGVLALFQ
jgi:flagellin